MEPNNKASSSLEFFKVFLPSSSSLHMCIPPAFVKHFNGTLPSKVILKDDLGKSWHVSLEKVDNRVYFKDGWQAFVDDHFLKYGDFLIFQYDGNYMFDVRLFGKNGCKKELLVVAGNSVPNVKIKGEPRVEKEDGKALVSCKRKRLKIRSNGRSDTIHKSRSISTPNLGKRNAPRTAKHVASKRPCFERTMKRWSSTTLYVSSRALRAHKILLKPNVILRDEEGKLWPAAISSTTQDRISLISGWTHFYREHNLRVNDKCEFEFVVGRGNRCRQINVKVTRHSLA